jgi:hypothetical protein
VDHPQNEPVLDAATIGLGRLRRCHDAGYLGLAAAVDGGAGKADFHIDGARHMDVQRIAGVHGRLRTIADVYKAIEKRNRMAAK